jgi:hypothetical protein
MIIGSLFARRPLKMEVKLVKFLSTIGLIGLLEKIRIIGLERDIKTKAIRILIRIKVMLYAGREKMGK